MSDQVNSKVVIVGDGAIGKTCILARLTNDSIDWEKQVDYEPTTFNNFKVSWPGDVGDVDLEIWDTAGQESFEQLRKLSFPGTDIYLVGYSTTSNISLTNVEHKWLPEIKEHHTDGAEEPWVVLVGTKVDIRTDVTTADAEAVGKKINACLGVETSAKAETGVDELKSMIMSLAFTKAKGDPRPNFHGKFGLPPDEPEEKPQPNDDEKKKKAKKDDKDVPCCTVQ